MFGSGFKTAYRAEVPRLPSGFRIFVYEMAVLNKARADRLTQRWRGITLPEMATGCAFQEKKGASMQIVFVLGAAFLVFLIFFLAFSIKRRENDEPVRIHNCHNCNCAKKEGGHLERFRAQAEAAADSGRHVHHRQIGDVREKNADPS